ncbi:MAG: hypothetical protein K5860_11450 [Bacteroidales bacterium]|nr:hypothetical protein [Bacteroidales bacterium]
MNNIYEIKITLSKRLEEIDKTEIEALCSNTVEIKIANNTINFVSKGNKSKGKKSFSKLLSKLIKYGLILGDLSLSIANNPWIKDVCDSILSFKSTNDLQSLFNEFGEDVNQTNFTSFIFDILPILRKTFFKKESSKKNSNGPIIIKGDNNVIIQNITIINYTENK